MRRAALAILTSVAVLAPASAHATVQTCTTTVSTVAAAQTAVSSAAVGSTVCLADGSYGKLTLSVSKAAPGVTVQAAHPGAATIAGASLSGSYLTLAQFHTVGDEITVQPGSTGMTIVHNLIEGTGPNGAYFGIDAGPTSSTQVNDVSIVGNKFTGEFGEDSIRLNRYHDTADTDPYGVLIKDNEFTGNRENGNHNDCIQAVWVGDHVYLLGNYFHDNRCQGFFIKDQATAVDTVVAEDNLMLRNDAACWPTDPSCGQPSIFQLFGPMSNLTVRRNTIWTPGGASPTTLRDPGWSGTRLFDSNVIYRAWTDTCSPFGTGYSATNNVSNHPPENATGGCWPATGFATVASPLFADPSTDDYRTNDGRGVTWKPSDKVFGPETAAPPPADTTPPETTITAQPSDSTSTDASFSFTSSESGSTFQCSLDGGAYSTCTSPKTYTALSVGGHVFSVKATDAAGNTDPTPASASWTVQAPADADGDGVPDAQDACPALAGSRTDGCPDPQETIDLAASRDAWKDRALTAEAQVADLQSQVDALTGKLAQIHDLSAP